MVRDTHIRNTPAPLIRPPHLTAQAAVSDAAHRGRGVVGRVGEYAPQRRSHDRVSSIWRRPWTTQRRADLIGNEQSHEGTTMIKHRLTIVVWFVLLLLGTGAAAWAYDDSEELQVGRVLEAGPIDSSRVEVGALAGVVYGQGERHPVLGEWVKRDTARGYIRAVDWEQWQLMLTREQREGMETLALDRVQTLTVIDTSSSGSGATLDSLAESRKNMSTGKRVALRLIAGTLGGVIGVAMVSLSLPCFPDDYAGDYDSVYCKSAEAALRCGYPVGIAIGVSLVGPRDRPITSLIRPLVLSLGGSAVGLIGGIWLANVDADVFWPSIPVFPIVGATLASELWRKPSTAHRISVGLMPNLRGSLSAVAALHF